MPSKGGGRSKGKKKAPSSPPSSSSKGGGGGGPPPGSPSPVVDNPASLLTIDNPINTTNSNNGSRTVASSSVGGGGGGVSTTSSNTSSSSSSQPPPQQQLQQLHHAGGSRRASWRNANLGSLSETEMSVFCDVWAQARQRQVSLQDACAIGEDREALLLRFLRANQFNATKTLQMLQEDVAWRVANDIHQLRRCRPRDILGCDVSELVKFYPHGHVGFDKQGRPIIIQRYGGFEVWNIKKLTTLEAVVRYHIWEQERACALLAKQARVTGKPVNTFCMIIDVADMGMGKITSEFLWLVQRIAEVDQKHYPERLGAMFIINVPSVFPLVWKGVKPWLDVKTTAKIKIFAKPAEWQPVLSQSIDPDQLPKEYGGTGTPLCQRDHSDDVIDLILPGTATGNSSTDGTARAGSIRHLHSLHASGGDRSSMMMGSLLAGGTGGATTGGGGTMVSAAGGGGASGDAASEDSELYEDAIMLDVELYEAEQAERLGLSTEQWAQLIHEWRSSRQLPMYTAGSRARYSKGHGGFTTTGETDSSHIYAGSIGGGGPGPAGGPGGASGAAVMMGGETSLWTDQLAYVLDAAPVSCFLCRRVLSWDIDRLRHSIERALVCSQVFAVMVIAFGVYVLASMYWISDLVEVMMWLAVVIVCLGSLVLLVSFVGYLGTRYGNRVLLNMYVTTMTPVSLILLIVAFVCFASASSHDSELYRITWSRLSRAFPSSVHLESIRESIQHDNLLLAAGSLCVSWCNFVPCLLGILLSLKLKHRPRPSHTDDESHLRVVMRVSCYVVLAFGMVCVLFGAYALHYTMGIYLSDAVFNPFLLLQSGIVLLISSIFGLRVSTSESPLLMNFYLALLLPLTAALLSLGISSFVAIKSIGHHVHREYSVNQLPQGTTISEMESWSKASLIVGGTLEVVTAVFQIVNATSVFVLRRVVAERWYLYRYRTFRPLRKSERLIIAWGVASGIVCIFFEGTFVIFHNWLADSRTAEQLWYLDLFRWIGEGDARYVNSNPFIVSSGGLLAVLVGPACLFFSYTIYSRKPYRYLLGTIICSVLAYSQLLYYATEIENGFSDITNARTSAFWIYFMIVNLAKLVVPAVLLQFMLRKSTRKLQRLKNFEIVEVVSRLAGTTTTEMGSSAGGMMQHQRGLTPSVRFQALEDTGPPLPISMNAETKGPNSLGYFLATSFGRAAAAQQKQHRHHHHHHHHHHHRGEQQEEEEEVDVEQGKGGEEEEEAVRRRRTPTSGGGGGEHDGNDDDDDGRNERSMSFVVLPHHRQQKEGQQQQQQQQASAGAVGSSGNSGSYIGSGNRAADPLTLLKASKSI